MTRAMTRAVIFGVVFGAWAALGIHFGFVFIDKPLQIVALVAGSAGAAVASSEILR
jgi:hypothetical protein